MPRCFNLSILGHVLVIRLLDVTSEAHLGQLVGSLQVSLLGLALLREEGIVVITVTIVQQISFLCELLSLTSL